MSLTVPETNLAEESASGVGVNRKSHLAKNRSVSSVVTALSLVETTPIINNKKPVSTFKVEAEIVKTDSLTNVVLFDNTEMPNVQILDAGAANSSNDLGITSQAQSSVQPTVGDANNNDQVDSDSEETFVYETPKAMDNDETRSILEGDRPILVHKNSARMAHRATNPQPRAFSQTVIPDNESIISKKLVPQRRIPTLQQPPANLQQPIQASAQPRFGSKYQQSISSRSNVFPSIRAPDPSDFTSQLNSDESDRNSFISGAFSQSDSDDDMTTQVADETNTTLKLKKTPISSPMKSFSDPVLLMSNKNRSKTPIRNPNSKTTIKSQVRDVSKNLFENEKSYLKKKLSYDSLREDDERSLLLHSLHEGGSDEDMDFYSNHTHYKMKNNNNIAYHDQWNSNFSFTDTVNRKNHLHGKRNASMDNEDVYYYPTYESVNPHNYVSKFKKQNIFLKVLSVMLKFLLVSVLMVTMGKLMIFKFLTNPIQNFEITKIEKLIIADNLLIFDVNCSCTNVNLQDVTVSESDLDVFITYSSEKETDKTLLLGNIASFSIPLKFSGLLNGGQVPFMKIFSSNYTRSVKQTATGQLKLSGDFKEVNEDIDSIINKPFELDIRGSFKYDLPLSSSSGLMSVSKKYKYKE